MVNTRVEIYAKNGTTLKYALDNYCDDINVKSHLTSQIGNFHLAVPTQKGGDTHYKFNDVVKQDLVKIWIENSSINPGTDTPKMVGRVQSVSAQGKKDGIIKVINGLDQGEVLQRRITSRKSWVGLTANQIVTELANDLSLGTSKISSDVNVIASLVIDDQAYFEVLKKLSDYWISAGTQIKKDFYVDEVADLVWKARPFRTTPVITPVYKQDFIDYTLVNDGVIGELHNRINVYGKRVPFNAKDLNTIGRTNPVNGDSWTYDATWVATLGTVTQQTVPAPKVGSDYCMMTVDPSTFEVKIKHVNTACSVDGNAGYSQIQFWLERKGVFALPYDIQLSIHAPDSSNYFITHFTDPGVDWTWTFYIRALGPNNMYDAINNPTGEFTVGAGTPNWDKMSALEFYTMQFNATDQWDLDGLCYSYGRWRNTASDATSQTAYDLHETSYTDDDLSSDAECQARAESLLFQMKDPIKRLDFAVKGTNRVKLGDQLAITLPPENLSAANFQVTSLEHATVKTEGWATKLTMLGTGSTRKMPPITAKDAVTRELRRYAELTRGLKFVGK